jgi:hypothetical protein
MSKVFDLYNVDDIKEMEAELARLRDQLRWRDVRVELPKENGMYLVYQKWPSGGFVDTGQFYAGRFMSVAMSHWRPLPELPEARP